MRLFKEIAAKKSRSYIYFAFFLLLFFALMITVEVNNGKFWTNDLKVYHAASVDYISGLSPYEHAYGLSTGYFKYPPTTLLFFFPLAILPFFLAQLLHSFVLLAACFMSIILIRNQVFFEVENSKKKNGILYLLFIFIGVHVVREVHLGNLNLVLLLLFMLGIFAFKKEKNQLFIFCWSLMIIIKPIVIIAFIPIGIFTMWKEIGWMIAFGITYFFLPILFSGSGFIELWNDWFVAVSDHGNYIVSENSLTYLANYYFDIQSNWLPSLFALGFLLSCMLFEKKIPYLKTERFVAWSSIFLAFTPNFFVTDTEHFLLSLPMIALLFMKIRDLKVWYFWIPFCLLMIGYSLKSNDLWGSYLGGLFTEFGILGIANLTLISYYIILRRLPTQNELLV